MATKSFNDICVEYEHQLGKGLPLTAPEMCNAVIMYLNAQITEMQGITSALQSAVTEATNTANELSEKVDTLQTNVTEAESNATEALNKTNDVSETVNALPKVPTPTTTDNGKVIGVQSGVYALVEQSGGEAPANMVTTDTSQIITSSKTFRLPADSSSCGIIISKTGSDIYNCYYPGFMRVFKGTSGNTTLHFSPQPNAVYDLFLPNKNGFIACVDDIPDLDNYTGTMHIVQGTAGSGVAVHDTANTSPYTKYGYDKIETYGNSNTLRYTLNIPNKNGTIATLDDISNTLSTSKYFTRIIYHSIDEDTQYILFSCVTDKDLSSNTDYADVVSLLNELGATTQDTALSCTGKTVSGAIVVGVYTEGNNIIIFDIDNAVEELSVSAEIKFISR